MGMLKFIATFHPKAKQEKLGSFSCSRGLGGLSNEGRGVEKEGMC